MIPSTNNKLLVSQDWKKIYQSFRNPDFKSYDFDTLKRTMIQYLQENFPEDFNDFIESSEYIALIDLLAFLGQNLSFRIDLNARENFLETAERRDSILRLAQLISYVPTRNVPARGFLKVTSIVTTDSVIDSNGLNLSNAVISWNDPTNSNWYQQFTAVLNSAMQGSSTFGKPYDRATIDGILTEQYRINSSNKDLPIYSFSKNIDGTSMSFEIVPSTFLGSTEVYEEPPRPGNTFSLIYKNDNQGANSPNTGFFVHFRQGQMGMSTFTIDQPVSNEIVGVNTPSINDTDVWLWQLNPDGTYPTTPWTKVSSTVGYNVIYNSLNKDQRKIYAVTTRDQDQIDLNFADGSFGDLPKGSFRLFYRQSNGLSYIVSPEQMRGIVIEIPYDNKLGQSHTLKLVLALQYVVSNSAGPESNTSIQTKAPQAYYTQNRMVTAEDYNIAPLMMGTDILKVKSVNRISSGLSKYFDLSDVSGKYSKTNIFATDGILYKLDSEQSFQFTVSNRNQILATLMQYLNPVLLMPSLRSFYLDKYPRPQESYIVWNRVTNSNGQCSGYFSTIEQDKEGPVNVGEYTESNLKYVTVGSLIKFVPPSEGMYFRSNGTLVNSPGKDTVNYLWAKVIQVNGDGSNSGLGPLDDGTGPIVLGTSIDSAAVMYEIVPKFVDILTYEFESELVTLCMNKRNFGLSFSKDSRTWNIIYDTNLDLTTSFSLGYQGVVDNSNKDSSWLVAFVWNGVNYNVRYRLTDYIFESSQETAFYSEPNSVNYDYTTNTVIKDKVTILSINTMNTSNATSLGKDYIWQIDGPVIETDGYIEPKKVKVSFYDANVGQTIDIDAFNNIVDPESTVPEPVTSIQYKDKFVFFKKSSDGLRYSLVSSDQFICYPTPDDVQAPIYDQQLVYFYDPAFNIVKRYSSSLANTGDPWVYTQEEASYFAYSGRDNIKFHYVHNSDEDRRIDPSKSNIIDVYLLTASYDSAFRYWLTTGNGTEPVPPTSQSLEQNYAYQLNDIKTVSDEIVFQPVKYKILFGDKADPKLKATFKAVRNSSRSVSDSDLKSRILTAIDDFFSLNNWDFGQSFNFSELVTYVMNIMTPDITNFVIVPNASDFGSLYEIACQSNEIFINGTSSNDIEIIDAITASQLKVTSIVTSSEG